MNLLSLMTLLIIPLIASVAIALFIEGEVAIRRVAKAISGLLFVYSLFFILFLDPANGTYQVTQEILNAGKLWLQPLGISFSLALDGVSLVMVVLTTFITFLAMVLLIYTQRVVSLFRSNRIFSCLFNVLAPSL